MPEATPQRPEPTRRERQVLDAVFALGESSVNQVREGMDQPPSYSAVRAALAVLVEKGWLEFRKQGRQYLYKPAISARSVRRSALRKVLDTFFEGSLESAVSTLIDLRKSRLKQEELDRIAQLIDEAREERA